LENGQGELLGNFLYAYRAEPTFNYIELKDNPISLIEQVIYWEQQISTGITIDVQPKPDKTGFRIIYGSKGAEGKKSIENLRAENVGFGVSYSLSVVTALLSARPGALIMIENPEAHLHPDGQAKLAELMCLVAQRGVQVIAETHSDHIINGVLVNCKRFEKEGRGIDRENVSIYYFSGQDENHAVQYEEVKVLEDGKIEFQPFGFFDRIEKDIDYLLGE
jgi:predicted ATPase